MAASLSTQIEQTQQQRYEYSVFRLDSLQHPPPKTQDIFNFCISTALYSNTIIDSYTLLLYHPFQCICCQNFFQEGQSFLRTFLSHPRFSAESLDQIIDGVISEVRELFEIDQSLHINTSDPSESQPQEFHLGLEIILYDDDDVDVVMEDSMQDFRMIPASKKVIQRSLKKSKVKKQNQHCTICLEEFDVIDDGLTEGYTMPCNHMFHQQCIVHWLQTNHVCPLCRYSLSTVDD